jgi:hypothetical protein
MRTATIELQTGEIEGYGKIVVRQRESDDAIAVSGKRRKLMHGGFSIRHIPVWQLHAHYTSTKRL